MRSISALAFGLGLIALNGCKSTGAASSAKDINVGSKQRFSWKVSYLLENQPSLKVIDPRHNCFFITKDAAANVNGKWVDEKYKLTYYTYAGCEDASKKLSNVYASTETDFDSYIAYEFPLEKFESFKSEKFPSGFTILSKEGGTPIGQLERRENWVVDEKENTVAKNTNQGEALYHFTTFCPDWDKDHPESWTTIQTPKLSGKSLSQREDKLTCNINLDPSSDPYLKISSARIFGGPASSRKLVITRLDIFNPANKSGEVLFPNHLMEMDGEMYSSFDSSGNVNSILNVKYDSGETQRFKIELDQTTIKYAFDNGTRWPNRVKDPRSTLSDIAQSQYDYESANNGAKVGKNVSIAFRAKKADAPTEIMTGSVYVAGVLNVGTDVFAGKRLSNPFGNVKPSTGGTPAPNDGASQQNSAPVGQPLANPFNK